MAPLHTAKFEFNTMRTLGAAFCWVLAGALAATLVLVIIVQILNFSTSIRSLPQGDPWTSQASVMPPPTSWP